MQLGGVGGHSADAHHVTNCIHPHVEHRQETGGAAAMQANAAALQALQKGQEQQTAQFSLQDFLRKALGGGRRFLGKLWGSSDAGISGQSGKEGQSQMLSMVLGSEEAAKDSHTGHVTGDQLSQPDITHGVHAARVTAAASAVIQPASRQSNPYFSAVQDVGRQQETLWEKVRVRLKSAAGRLAGHLPGRFFSKFSAQTKSSFQAGQEKPREDLRKKSKYRKDELEIDCVLTDESYLLDSYDRKGEYSKLTTEK